MQTPKRARKGALRDAIGIYVQLSPKVYEDYVRASTERGITKRRLVEAAIKQELTNPTVFAEDEQEELPLKTA